jgi:predicted porin
MQKKLIALAVAGLASSAAFAQSNVTIYGLLQPSYDFVEVKETNGDKQKLTAMNWNASRVGFKGEEALGNGLKAIFQLETYFDLTKNGDGGTDANGAFVGSRDSWVGLAGNFGSITFGTHDNALKKTFAKYDRYADSLADIQNIFTNGVGSRDANSAYYTSPMWSGFQLSANYALDGTKDSGTTEVNNTKWAIAGAYTNGGLGLNAAYGEGNQQAGDDNKEYRLGAMYTFGFGTTLAGLYGNAKGFDPDAGANYDVDFWGVEAWHPITSNIELGASYLDASENNDVAGANDGAKNYNIALKYSLSKRTNVLAAYTHLKNDAGGAYGLDAGYGGGAGSKATGFTVRLAHSF